MASTAAEALLLLADESRAVEALLLLADSELNRPGSSERTEPVLVPLRGQELEDAILNLLLSARPSGASERVIREKFGNNPDTSKTLRMLLKLGKVERSGAGGRRGPYIYKVLDTATIE